MHSRFTRWAVGATVALSLFGAVGVAQASSLTSAQVSAIIGLLQSFGADQSVINSVSATLGGQTSSGLSCASFADVSYGQFDDTSGGRVSQLQTWLGIPSSTFGFGTYGHKTQAAWNSQCGGTQPTPQPNPIPTSTPTIAITTSFASIGGSPAMSFAVQYDHMPAAGVNIINSAGSVVWTQQLTAGGGGSTVVALSTVLPAGNYTAQAFGQNANGSMVYATSAPYYFAGSSAPTCTLKTDKTTASPGDSITETWTSNNAVSAFFLADSSVAVSGSRTKQTDPSATNYTWNDGLVVQDAAGNQGKCAATVQISGNLVASTATISQSSLTTTSGTPTLSGTASGVSAVYITVSGNNQYGTSNGGVSVTNGQWSTTINPRAIYAFPVGTYTVQVLTYNGSSVGTTVLATGTLTINASNAPTCTITPAVTFANPGQSITVTWTSQNAVSAAFLAGNTVAVNGSQTFTTDPNSTNYTWTQALGVQDSAGTQGRCTVSVPIGGNTVSPTATINQSSLTTTTSGTPTITGTAGAGVYSVYVEVSGNGQYGTSSGGVSVTNGQWSTTIYPRAITAFPSGTYTVQVLNYNGSSVGTTVLATGTLTISAH